MRRWIIVPLVPMLVACSGPAATQVAPAPAPTAQVAAATPAAPKPAADKPAADKPAVSTPTAAPRAEAKAEPAAKAGPKATIAPPEQNGGIQFGQPIKIGPNSVAILITNTTDEVKSFDASVEYKKGPVSVAATGKVGELGPKQTRAVSLVATTLLPSEPDAIVVGLGKLREVDREDAAAIAKISVGEPTQREGSTTYVVDVTNGDSASRVVGLSSAYMKGDEMVAYGEASVPVMKTGETRTVTVRPVTGVPAYDRVVITVRGIV